MSEIDYIYTDLSNPRAIKHKHYFGELRHVGFFLIDLKKLVIFKSNWM